MWNGSKFNYKLSWANLILLRACHDRVNCNWHKNVNDKFCYCHDVIILSWRRSFFQVMETDQHTHQKNVSISFMVFIGNNKKLIFCQVFLKLLIGTWNCDENFSLYLILPWHLHNFCHDIHLPQSAFCTQSRPLITVIRVPLLLLFIERNKMSGMLLHIVHWTNAMGFFIFKIHKW